MVGAAGVQQRPAAAAAQAEAADLGGAFVGSRRLPQAVLVRQLWERGRLERGRRTFGRRRERERSYLAGAVPEGGPEPPDGLEQLADGGARGRRAPPAGGLDAPGHASHFRQIWRDETKEGEWR